MGLPVPRGLSKEPEVLVRTIPLAVDLAVAMVMAAAKGMTIADCRLMETRFSGLVLPSFTRFRTL